MTANLSPEAFLDFCQKEKAGLVVLKSISTVSGRNGLWRVEYEEVKDFMRAGIAKEAVQGPRAVIGPDPSAPITHCTTGGSTPPPAPVSKAVCFDCGKPYDGPECPLCAPLARCLAASKRMRRDRELEKRFPQTPSKTADSDTDTYSEG